MKVIPRSRPLLPTAHRVTGAIVVLLCVAQVALGIFHAWSRPLDLSSGPSPFAFVSSAMVPLIVGVGLLRGWLGARRFILWLLWLNLPLTLAMPCSGRIAGVSAIVGLTLLLSGVPSIRRVLGSVGLFGLVVFVLANSMGVVWSFSPRLGVLTWRATGDASFASVDHVELAHGRYSMRVPEDEWYRMEARLELGGGIGLRGTRSITTLVSGNGAVVAMTAVTPLFFSLTGVPSYEARQDALDRMVRDAIPPSAHTSQVDLRVVGEHPTAVASFVDGESESSAYHVLGATFAPGGDAFETPTFVVVEGSGGPEDSRLLDSFVEVALGTLREVDP